MFDIGFWELVLIAVIGLVVLGPERLPIAIRNVSRWVGAAKRMAGSVRDELEQELKIKELQDNLHKAEQAGMKNLSPELQESVETLRQRAADVQHPYASSATSTAAARDTESADTATSPSSTSSTDK
ncbi:twin arginine-targeting protein translocase TatB [Salinivibrio sp. MA427]|uniref:Sec-independent protein translocase protein TatB n=1 Tax=Salinivibrio sp. MA427 TaxID=1909455 RepID=UPI00098A0D41|nr:Sec-independent protein translocase protein TatB [Salinivibrio sp. MA427]OOF20110.1 twin arginine-targeting protein translocase TatB [Salinivibrio sp. MA427]